MTTINPFEDARLFAPPPEQKPRNDLGQDDFQGYLPADS